jgi:hypothetical protein
VRKKEEIGDALRGRHEVVSGGPFAVTSNAELRATVVFKQCPQPKKLNGRPHLPQNVVSAKDRVLSLLPLEQVLRLLGDSASTPNPPQT